MLRPMPIILPMEKKQDSANRIASTAASHDFGLVRVDDRLLHGQIIAVWCKHQPFTQIVIVDDATAADPFFEEVLTLAAPPSIQVRVFSLDEGIRALGREDVPHKTTMILLKSPADAVRLYEGGIHYTALNIGGLSSRSGRRNVYKNIAIAEEELALLETLAEQGVAVTFLTVPGEKPRGLREILKQGPLTTRREP